MKNIVIAGAGPAGLTAAYELLKMNKNYNVTIIEKLDIVGGISRTENYKGNRFDIGGHRFFSKSKKVMDWWNNILPMDSDFRTDLDIYNTVGKDKMLLRNRLSRILFRRDYYDYPLNPNLKTLSSLGISTTISIGVSYLHSMTFNRKKPNNLEEFFIQRFGRVLYGMFFEEYTEKVWGVPCHKISADWGAQRIKGLDIKKAIFNAFKKNSSEVETSLIDKFWYPQYGPGQMWEKVARDVISMGARLIMNETVTGLNVDSTNNCINEVLYSSSNTSGVTTSIKSDYFISTLPIKDLGQFLPLKKSILSLTSKLEYRDFITVGLLIDITIDNLSLNDNWIYVQENDVKVGRLQIFNNWSPLMVKDSTKTWIGLEYFCNKDDSLWSMSNDKMINFAKEELEILNICNTSAVIDGKVLRVEKAYPSYIGGHDNMDTIISSLDSFTNLFCIGRNGMHRYNNMDHSMLSAIKAVDLINKNCTNKYELWKTNTEDEYHEK